MPYHAYEHTTSHLCSFVVVICSPVQERRQTDMIMHSMHYNNTKESQYLQFSISKVVFVIMCMLLTQVIPVSMHGNVEMKPLFFIETKYTQPYAVVDYMQVVIELISNRLPVVQ